MGLGWNFADENFVHKLFGQKQSFILRFLRKRPLYACDNLKSKAATNTNFAILADKIFDSLNRKFMTACLGKS